MKFLHKVNKINLHSFIHSNTVEHMACFVHAVHVPAHGRMPNCQYKVIRIKFTSEYKSFIQFIHSEMQRAELKKAKIKINKHLN